MCSAKKQQFSNALFMGKLQTTHSNNQFLFSSGARIMEQVSKETNDQGNQWHEGTEQVWFQMNALLVRSECGSGWSQNSLKNHKNGIKTAAIR